MGSGAAVVAGNVPVRASFSALFRSSTYNEKLTYLDQIYFYTLHPNAYAIEMEARQPRFEQQTVAVAATLRGYGSCHYLGNPTG